MKPKTLVPIALVLGLFLLGSGLAEAAEQSKLDSDGVLEQLKSIARMLVAAILIIFIIVGGYTIITSVAEARRNGGWGHVVVGIVMVLVAGLSLWGLLSMTGQDPQGIMNRIKLDGK